MATFTKFQSFVADIANGVHKMATDTLTIFLTDQATPPLVTNSILSNITQISYTNLSSRVLTISSSTQTSGKYSLRLSDLTLTATGTVATFRYVGVYNDSSASDSLVGFYDHGSEVALKNGDTYAFDLDGTLLTIQ